jgi:hypothetical protein
MPSRISASNTNITPSVWYEKPHRKMVLEYSKPSLLRRFYNNFPYHSTINSIEWFLKAFIAIYNWVLLNGLS